MQNPARKRSNFPLRGTTQGLFEGSATGPGSKATLETPAVRTCARREQFRSSRRTSRPEIDAKQPRLRTTNAAETHQAQSPGGFQATWTNKTPLRFFPMIGREMRRSTSLPTSPQHHLQASHPSKPALSGSARAGSARQSALKSSAARQSAHLGKRSAAS